MRIIIPLLISFNLYASEPIGYSNETYIELGKYRQLLAAPSSKAGLQWSAGYGTANYTAVPTWYGVNSSGVEVSVGIDSPQSPIYNTVEVLDFGIPSDAAAIVVSVKIKCKTIGGWYKGAAAASSSFYLRTPFQMMPTNESAHCEASVNNNTSGIRDEDINHTNNMVLPLYNGQFQYAHWSTVDAYSQVFWVLFIEGYYEKPTP